MIYNFTQQAECKGMHSACCSFTIVYYFFKKNREPFCIAEKFGWEMFELSGFENPSCENGEKHPSHLAFVAKN